MKKIIDFIRNIPEFIKVATVAILFLIMIFITIITENPLPFLIYFAFLTAMFMLFCFLKFKKCISTAIHGRLTTGKVVNSFGKGKGKSYAWIQYSTKDGNTHQNTFPTIAFLFSPLIYNKNNPDDAMTLLDFIAKELFFITSAVAFTCEIFIMIQYIKR